MYDLRKNKRFKKLTITLLVAIVFGMSLGFAFFSTSLNIEPSANVSVNSANFGVKFSNNKDSLVVGAVIPSSKTQGVETKNGAIDNSGNPTIKNLSATFSQPGQFAEYTFFARNEGEYVAYLNNINFLGEKVCTAKTETLNDIVQNACNYISIIVNIDGTTYTDTTLITSHPLKQGEGEEIKVTLSYDADGIYVDEEFSITFPNIALVYSTIDDSTIEPAIKVVNLESGDIDIPGSIVSIGKEKFYVMKHAEGKVKLLAMHNLYVGGIYDSGWKAYGSEATGIQDATMKGFVSGEKVRKGTTAFSTKNYWQDSVSSYPADVYGMNSTVYNYVENYKSYLESKGVTIEECRLITYAELEELGCSGATHTCKLAPSWVYSSSYWTATAADARNVFNVYSDGLFSVNYYYLDYDRGVRPVIVISVSEFKK